MSETVPIGQTFPVLDGRHHLTVLSLKREAESFSVDYTLTPALPGDQPGQDVVFMWVQATDDLGTVYSDGGGARGLSDDGTHTVGVVSAQPALAAEARKVSLKFVFLSGGVEHEQKVIVALA